MGGSPRWLDQVEELSRAALPGPVFEYIAESAREGLTAADNLAAWREVRFLPRVLTDVRTVHLGTELLGGPATMPVGVAPMTLQRAAHPDGELAMAAAARDAGLPMVVSSNAGSRFADIGATGVDWWLQVYVAQDRAETEPLLQQAVEGGARAVVLTADTPVLGTRYPGENGSVWDHADPSWVGANAVTTAHFRPEDRDKALDLGPEDVAWLADRTGLPVAVKGVLRGDDARRCVDAGAAAVWVSNHGGRQLDQAMPTAACVAGVRAAVGEDAQVYVDGGIRAGTHVLAALALGADAAFVGRPLFHALAAAGPDGVGRALAELRTEVEESLRLAGCATVADTRGIVGRAALPPR